MPGVALLPVGDLLDHDPERHVSWHTGPTGTDPFSFICHSSISNASPANHHKFLGPQDTLADKNCWMAVHVTAGVLCAVLIRKGLDLATYQSDTKLLLLMNSLPIEGVCGLGV